jgi:hypothetical protein
MMVSRFRTALTLLKSSNCNEPANKYADEGANPKSKEYIPVR